MRYTVQTGDIIAKVTGPADHARKEANAANPQAIGRPRQNGQRFPRERMTILSPTGRSRFADALKAAKKVKSSGGMAASQTQTPGREILHVVQKGETIWRLATEKYGVDPDALRQFNHIDDPRRLQIGQVLRIPERLPAFQPPPANEDIGEIKESAGHDLAARLTSAVASRLESAITTTEREAGKAVKVVASWYGQYHHGRMMANGEPFNMYGATIAHKDLPLGAKVRLENPETGERVIATVTDRGPYIAGRDVDLSYGVAKRLSLTKQGVGKLLMTVL